MEPTSARILEEARQLIMRGGYHGFSYADVAAGVGIRKASIHHHFAGKSDLAKAVVEQSRAGLKMHAEQLEATGADAQTRLRAYVGYWERCISDGSAPFCVAAMLAAELPGLPSDVAEAVRAHFAELTSWLAGVLASGVQQGTMTLRGAPGDGADAVVAAIHGAMVSARALGDPRRFTAILETLLSDMVTLH